MGSPLDRKLSQNEVLVWIQRSGSFRAGFWLPSHGGGFLVARLTLAEQETTTELVPLLLGPGSQLPTEFPQNLWCTREVSGWRGTARSSGSCTVTPGLRSSPKSHPQLPADTGPQLKLPGPFC